ncbi:hypothetical protein B0H11DRAFT_2406640 [Mycena galericulata]|nr:hypothetical protein B0H11DRAFT_2406640 [Mycena galericulata]
MTTTLDSDVALPPMTQNPSTPYKPSLSDSTLYPALARHGISVMHFPAFWAGVCIDCGVTLNPGSPKHFGFNLRAHFKNKHSGNKLTATDVSEIDEECARLVTTKAVLTQENAGAMVKTIPPLVEEVSWLRSRVGWACTFNGCRHVSYDSDKTRHRNAVHNGKSLRIEGEWTEACTLQSLSPSRKTLLFRVHSSLTLGAVKPGNGFLEFLQSTHDDPAFEARLKPQLVITGDPRQHLDPFHAKTLWPVRVQKYSVPDLISLVRLPEPGSNDPLLKLSPVSMTWITSLNQSIDDVEPVHLRRLTEKSIFRTIGPRSHQHYATLARKVAVFAIRTVRRDQDAAGSEESLDLEATDWGCVTANQIKEGADDDKVEDSDEDTDEDSDDDDDDSNAPDSDTDGDSVGDAETGNEEYGCTSGGSSEAAGEIYPVFLTGRQKTAAWNLWDALTQNSTPETIESKFHQLLLALFTDIDDTPGRRIYTPMEAFLFISNVRKNGTIRNAKSVSPELSGIQYAILFSIIREAIASKEVGPTLDRLSRWFDPKQISPFATVRYMQCIATAAVINAVSIGRIFFRAEGEPEFEFDGVEYSVLDWIKFPQKMWQDANRIYAEIVFQHSDEDFQITAFQQDHIHIPNKTDLGYGFAPISGEYDKKILAVVWDQLRERHHKQNDWSAVALLGTLSQIHRLKELIFGILHTTCGAPKRISELLLFRLWNTDCPRSVYMIFKRFFLVGGYSKTTNTTGFDKLTLHVIAPAMERLFLQFCLVILPLERSIIYLLKGTQRRIKLSKKYFRRRLRASDMRQMVPGVMEHCGVDSVEQRVHGAVVASQMGHSLGVHMGLYKRRKDLPNRVTFEMVHRVTKFSAAWHGVLGFAGCDGPTEVTADGLKQFLRQLHPTLPPSIPPELTAQLNAIRQHQIDEQIRFDTQRRESEELRQQLQVSEAENADLRRELEREKRRNASEATAGGSEFLIRASWYL